MPLPSSSKASKSSRARFPSVSNKIKISLLFSSNERKDHQKRYEKYLGQSCACFCLGPSTLSELSPTPSMRPRLQTALMAAGSFFNLLLFQVFGFFNCGSCCCLFSFLVEIKLKNFILTRFTFIACKAFFTRSSLSTSLKG